MIPEKCETNKVIALDNYLERIFSPQHLERESAGSLVELLSLEDEAESLRKPR